MNFSTLKEENQIQLLSQSEASSLFDSLEGLSLSQILFSFEQFPKEKSHLFQAIKKGEIIETQLSDFNFEKLKILNHSVILRHLEYYVPEITKITRNVFEQSKILLHCSLYLTPHQDAQASVFHSDYQHRLIYQVQGEKKWLFPLVEDKPIFEYAQLPFLNRRLNDGVMSCPFQESLLQEKMALYLPYGVSHKAINTRDEISAHLVFSEESVNIREMMTFIMEEIFETKGFEEKFFEDFENAPITLKSTVEGDFLQQAIAYQTNNKLYKFRK